MASEFLNFLSIGLSCLITGYFLATRKEDKKREAELMERTTVLNENLKNFHLAYQQFNDARLDMDTRLTSLEFALKGIERPAPRR